MYEGPHACLKPSARRGHLRCSRVVRRAWGGALEKTLISKPFSSSFSMPPKATAPTSSDLHRAGAPFRRCWYLQALPDKNSQHQHSANVCCTLLASHVIMRPFKSSCCMLEHHRLKRCATKQVWCLTRTDFMADKCDIPGIVCHNLVCAGPTAGEHHCC